MHLLAAQAGAPVESGEPVDLGQEPADIVFLSAADTELAALSAARQRLGEAGRFHGVSLRLANLLNFSHPFTVDRYIDTTASRSGLVIARVLGGHAYWGYGIEQFSDRLAAARVRFACIPGDDRPDEALGRFSNVDADERMALWHYLMEGGPENFDAFLLYAKSILRGGDRPQPARRLVRAGVYCPEIGASSLQDLQCRAWQEGAPVAALVFYRALLQSGDLQPVDELFHMLRKRGINPLPVFVASLKEPISAATVDRLFEQTTPGIVLNGTSFAVSRPQAEIGEGSSTPLDAGGAPVLQITFAGSTQSDWEAGSNGLSARDIAMGVALPEIDGRVYTRAVSFKRESHRDKDCQCPIARHGALPDRVDFVADLADNWLRLRNTQAEERKTALVLANYPNRDGRLANGVGLDTPASVVEALDSLRQGGWRVENAPGTVKELMACILAGPTNWCADRASRQGGERFRMAAYREHFGTLPGAVRQSVLARWGPPERDPFSDGDSFALSLHRFGNVAVGVQPARGYNIDPKETYHSPDLVPPHNYFAFYFWLRHAFRVHAIVHFGKHGNLEWLPGKSVALSEACFPEATLGPTPHVYPFIVNDPGEGTQAKRRAQAVIVDHLTPPLARAETYGELRNLEQLVDEYYQAVQGDPRRAKLLCTQILDLAQVHRIDDDAGIAFDDDIQKQLQRIDAFLCDIKESRIRDGLHVFGRSPDGPLRDALAASLAVTPRGRGNGRDQSILRALADDLGILDEDFDPLACAFEHPWTGNHPEPLRPVSSDPWRSCGDTVERLELLAGELIAGRTVADPAWRATTAVIEEVRNRLCPAIERCGDAERTALGSALAGRHISPGPSGAPSRGRLDVLPTGRNFYSVDSRAIPTAAAWTLGFRSASLLVERYAQDHGWFPTALTLSMWGTSNMRTGGDDIAQALALMGVRPTWDESSGRVTGFEILPASVLDRPRVDVTVRVSGFFRDAFPAQIELMGRAARAIMSLEEPEGANPAAARYREERVKFGSDSAGARVFGSKPGAYGAGLQALMDERIWSDVSDLAESYLTWSGYSYGVKRHGQPDRHAFETRLRQSEGVVHNQDNREHDLLDSDDYYQFEGGAAAAITMLRGTRPAVYHNDHSRPERPVIRTLDEEISRVMRARVVNPKWIAGVMRHGYKGAAEIAATVDYLFAFAATTGAVKPHHFDLVYRAFVEDPECVAFLEEHNPAASREIRQRLHEAIERDMWLPRSNSARTVLERGTGGKE